MKKAKIILGAKNTDLENIKNVVRLYAKAGANFFDVCANEKVIQTVRSLINSLGVENSIEICASITLGEDVHARKARLFQEECAFCGRCEAICPQKAIKDFVVKTEKCIGCNLCEKICPNGAIKSFYLEHDFQEQFIQAKSADFIEVHTNGKVQNLKEIFKFLKDNFNGKIGICISNNSDDDEKIEIIKMVRDITVPKVLVVQADGASVSGFSNDLSTTEKALLECEKFSEIEGIELIISGGTNGMTYNEAIKRNLRFDGIAWGSFARKILSDAQGEEQALEQAKELIKPLK